VRRRGIVFTLLVVLLSLAASLAGVDPAQVRAGISERFPVVTAASFSFAVGGLLLFKCLGELVRSVGSGAMPATATAYRTMVDQALDLGLQVPLCALVGVLLVKPTLGCPGSASTLILVMTVPAQ
jgi:hypothetical protein